VYAANKEQGMNSGLPENSVSLSIVVPIFNEEQILNDSIKELQECFIQNKGLLELIIVNDRSTDNSLEIVKNRFYTNQNIKIIDNKIRKGKAISVRDGIMMAEGEYIIFIDADLSVPVKEIKKILTHARSDTDVIIGVRDENNKTTVIIKPLYRKAISKIYNCLCNILFFKNKIIDIGCGFKAFKREVARDLFSNLYIKSWVFDVEILSKAIEKKYKIVQVPVDWAFKGKSHLNIYKDLVVAFCELLKFKIYLTIKNRTILL
jgi:dolichyl-phosphate beta-glucosyltransferase